MKPLALFFLKIALAVLSLCGSMWFEDFLFLLLFSFKIPFYFDDIALNLWVTGLNGQLLPNNEHSSPYLCIYIGFIFINTL